MRAAVAGEEEGVSDVDDVVHPKDEADAVQDGVCHLGVDLVLDCVWEWGFPSVGLQTDQAAEAGQHEHGGGGDGEAVFTFAVFFLLHSSQKSEKTAFSMQHVFVMVKMEGTRRIDVGKIIYK